MDIDQDRFKCLYYPFSRLLDPIDLKYLLLLFDSITFLDEAETPSWRKKLYKDLDEATQGKTVFSKFDRLADDYDMLTDLKAIQVLNPKSLRTCNSSEVALATIADLQDDRFVQMASKPSNYGLPYLTIGSRLAHSNSIRPTWQSFIGKIASPLLSDDRFKNQNEWISHILIPGHDYSSWTFSYEAGSAAVLNYYLEAAQELNLTPVTDSELHHKLVLRKLKRVFSENDETIDLIDDPTRRKFQAAFGVGEIINLFEELYPKKQLSLVSFQEIVKFRNETKELRRQFIQEINQALRVIDANPIGAKYDKEVIEAISELRNNFRKLENELTNIRDKIIPAFTKALLYGTAGGGAMSAFVSIIGGLSTSGLVAASALTITGALLNEALPLWIERRKLLRSQTSAISYLSKVSKI